MVPGPCSESGSDRGSVWQQKSGPGSDSGSGSASGTVSGSGSGTVLSAGSGSKSGLDSDFVSKPASLSQLKVGRDVGAMEGEGERDFGVSV